MHTSTTRRKQRSLVGLAIAGALAAVVIGTASPAAAATGLPLPYGEVDNVANGLIYYSGHVPVVSGWAIDGPFVNMTSVPIPVTANVTWYRKPAICALCTATVVGQTSFRQTADLYRAEIQRSPAGPDHGFAIPLTPPSAFSYTSERVCLTTTGYYGTSSLGCYTLAFQLIG